MSETPAGLAGLRAEIDRIDAAMHALLIERSEVIDRLVTVKDSHETGSAFRPGREAQMMRALALRHRGSLPLDTAEGIWRVIIGTFTYVQAPYSVHADLTGGDGPMRDSARFHFGFTVPYIPQTDPRSVIAAVAASRGDLGLVRIGQGLVEPWWLDLVGPDRPKIIARLPLIERPGHPAGTPVFVISKPVAEAAARELLLVSFALRHWNPELPAALAAQGGELISSAGLDGGYSVLAALPSEAGRAALAGGLTHVAGEAIECAEVGAQAARFHFDHSA